MEQQIVETPWGGLYGPAGPPVKRTAEAFECTDCGALVSTWYEQAHKDWHKKLDELKKLLERQHRDDRTVVLK